jgi:hypothetical protein
MRRTRSSGKETFAVRSFINHGADKNSLFHQNIEASIGELSFEIGDSFFSQTLGRVNAKVVPFSSSNTSLDASILASRQRRFVGKPSCVR